MPGMGLPFPSSSRPSAKLISPSAAEVNHFKPLRLRDAGMGGMGAVRRASWLRVLQERTWLGPRRSPFLKPCLKEALRGAMHSLPPPAALPACAAALQDQQGQYANNAAQFRPPFRGPLRGPLQGSPTYTAQPHPRPRDSPVPVSHPALPCRLWHRHRLCGSSHIRPACLLSHPLHALAPHRGIAGIRFA